MLRKIEKMKKLRWLILVVILLGFGVCGEEHRDCSRALVYMSDSDSLIWPVFAAYEVGVKKEYLDRGLDTSCVVEAFRRLKGVIEDIEGMCEFDRDGEEESGS